MNEARWLRWADADPAVPPTQWCGARLATRAEVKLVGFSPLLAGLMWGVRICANIHRMVVVSQAQERTMSALFDQERKLADHVEKLREAQPKRQSMASFAVLTHLVPEAAGAFRPYLCRITCRRADCAGQFNGPFTDGMPVASTISSWVSDFQRLDAKL